MTKLGLTLPSFLEEPAPAIEIARAAEASGVDGVFVFEHVWRGSDKRPALDPWTLLGALAMETSTITLGTLVARTTLRPAALLAAQFDTLRSIAGDRVVAGLGAGDHESAAENESFGLPFGTIDDRLEELASAVDGCGRRSYPVWVGGTHPRVLEIAARSDGWNRWGGDLAAFEEGVATVRAAASRPFTCSWGGLIVVGADERDAEAKRSRLHPGAGVLVGGPERVADGLSSFARAGAEWVIAAPVDSSDITNATLLGEAVRPHLVPTTPG